MIPDVNNGIGAIDRSDPEMLFSAFRTMLESQGDMVFIKDLDLRYRACTWAFAKMTGYGSAESIIGRTDHEIFADKKLAERFMEDDKKVLADGRHMIGYVEQINDEKGEARYSSTSKYILRGADGRPIGIMGVAKDVTSDIKARMQYQKEVEYLFTLPPETYCAILIDVEDWRIIGQRRQSIEGRMAPEYATVDELARSGAKSESEEIRAFYQSFNQKHLKELYLSGKTGITMEYMRTRDEDGPRWNRSELKFMINPEDGHLGLMVIISSIDKKKRAEKQAELAATTDGMTGLLNRAAAQRRIEEILKNEGAGGTHAVYVIDVDNFKAVNDLFGHRTGDELLLDMANTIRSCFRECDITARLGGDEFMVFAVNMPDRQAAAGRAKSMIDKIRGLSIAGTGAMVSISAGVSMYPEDGGTLEELYNSADNALYKAKKQGKNRAALASDEQYLFAGGEAAMRYEDYNSLIVDHSSSICYISELDTYELLHLTRAGMEVCGFKGPEEYRGRKCYEVLQGRTQPCPFCTNAKLVEGQDYRWEHYNENLDRWFDVTDSLLTINGRHCRMEIARDITMRKGHAALETAGLSMEDVLFRCLHILTTETEPKRAFRQFLKGVGVYYGSKRSYIFEFDYDAGTLSNSYEWCAAGVSAEKDNLQNLPLEVVANWVKKFDAEGEFSISSLHDDIDPDSDEYRILEAQGIHSLMAAPLMQRGRIVGFIGVDDPGVNQGNLTLLRSVTEFVQAELERRHLIEELEHMSYTDALTGLKNRNQYARVLREYSHRTPRSLGVVHIDINGMKGINDAHGQSYGDHVIRLTGTTAAENISGSVYRTGGDEFIALTEGISKEKFNRELMALRSAFELERECNVSIGSAWGEHEEETGILLKQAAENLVADKQRYYHSVLKEGRGARAKAGFAGEVAEEISNGRFMVYYQPQVDIKTGRIIGAEALVRKKGEDGSLIPPNKFIPFYEAEGVVDLVDLFVLHSACETIRKWLDQGHSMHMAVNFSRVTLLEPNIVEVISGICESYGVPTAAITIEVTESISKMGNDQLRELIERINEAGFTISLDDFGSKYSNLAILASMDFDEIKFDKSLVDSLENNAKSRIVMENTVKMCRELHNTNSLAEGIETKGQLELLADYRCDYGQGYYFSRPVPVEEFDLMLNGEQMQGRL